MQADFGAVLLKLWKRPRICCRFHFADIMAARQNIIEPGEVTSHLERHRRESVEWILSVGTHIGPLIAQPDGLQFGAPPMGAERGFRNPAQRSLLISNNGHRCFAMSLQLVHRKWLGGGRMFCQIGRDEARGGRSSAI